MWTVTILFGGGGSVSLIYEHEQLAKDTFKALSEKRNPSEDTYDPQVYVQDDYGTAATIDIAEVICHTLQDVKKAQIGNGELQLLNMKGNMQLQQKAQRDPALRLMMTQQPGGRLA
jgi:hypothetical protein